MYKSQNNNLNKKIFYINFYIKFNFYYIKIKEKKY